MSEQSNFETLEDDVQEMRDQILIATLPHVPFDGWTERAMTAGEASTGLGEGAAYRAFPGGLSDMAAHASDYFDRLMLSRLGELDLASMKVREKVAAGVRARIEACMPYKEAHLTLLGYLALPTRKAMTAKMAWATCSKIWYAAGDDATDFNYYTKRGPVSYTHLTLPTNREV